MKLKPCPFCGGRAKLYVKTSFARGITRGWEFGVFCTKCSVSTTKTDYAVEVQLDGEGNIVPIVDEREEAISTWNRRVSEC